MRNAKRSRVKRSVNSQIPIHSIPSHLTLILFIHELKVCSTKKRPAWFIEQTKQENLPLYNVNNPPQFPLHPRSMVSFFFVPTPMSATPDSPPCFALFLLPIYALFMFLVDDSVRSFDNDYPRRQPHSITNNAHYSVEKPTSSLSPRLRLPPPISTPFFSSLFLLF